MLRTMGATPSSSLWKPCPFMTYEPQTLRNEIAKIQSQAGSIMPGQNKRIVICAIGRDGKSSTINNILSALEGTYSNTACVGGGKHHVTHKYIEYQMLVGDLGHAEDQSFVLCDTPGLNNLQTDLKAEIIKAIIGGKFQSGDQVEYTNFTAKHLEDMKAVQPKAVCVIFVIAATKVFFAKNDKNEMIGEIQESEELKKLNDILQFTRYHDIKTACLLTKCDELDYRVKRNLRNIYYSDSIETARLVIQTKLSGFQEDRIFPIVNYTQSLLTNSDMMVHILFALKHIFNDIHSNLRRMVGFERTANLYIQTSLT